MLVLGSPGSATARLRPAAPGRRRCRRRSAERRGRVDIKRRTVDNSPPLGRVTLRVELTEPRGDGGPRLVDDRAVAYRSLTRNSSVSLLKSSVVRHAME